MDSELQSGPVIVFDAFLHRGDENYIGIWYEKRDYRVAYVRCPENHDHFILADPAVSVWAKTAEESDFS